jgi:hypothetical protein
MGQGTWHVYRFSVSWFSRTPGATSARADLEVGDTAGLETCATVLWRARTCLGRAHRTQVPKRRAGAGLVVSRTVRLRSLPLAWRRRILTTKFQAPSAREGQTIKVQSKANGGERVRTLAIRQVCAVGTYETLEHLPTRRFGNRRYRKFGNLRYKRRRKLMAGSIGRTCWRRSVRL